MAHRSGRRSACGCAQTGSVRCVAAVPRAARTSPSASTTSRPPSSTSTALNSLCRSRWRHPRVQRRAVGGGVWPGLHRRRAPTWVCAPLLFPSCRAKLIARTLTQAIWLSESGSDLVYTCLLFFVCKKLMCTPISSVRSESDQSISPEIQDVPQQVAP
jgi:hypothetical protein